MTRFRVEFNGVIVTDDDQIVTDRDTIQRVVDLILLEFTKLATNTPRVEGRPETGGLCVSVDVEESDMFMASVAGFSQIRTAVHAAGLGTPGWKVDWFKTTTIRPRKPASEALPV
jgi:hypothetical protein